MVRAWVVCAAIGALVATGCRSYIDRQPASLDADVHPTPGYPQAMFLDPQWFLQDDELGLSVIELTIQP